MNPGLNPAMSVEIGHRALVALMTPADRITLMIRSSTVLNPPPFRLDHFAMASDE
jgi:hypothetical protein